MIHKLLVLIFLVSSVVCNASNIPAFKDVGETLFIGIENTISIDLKGCDPELVEIKVSSGHLYKRSDSTYILNVSHVEDEFKIKLYYKKVICEIQSMKTARIPDPTLTFEYEFLVTLLEFFVSMVLLLFVIFISFNYSLFRCVI